MNREEYLKELSKYLKKLPKNEKNSYSAHRCTVYNRSRENREKASERLNGRET